MKQLVEPSLDPYIYNGGQVLMDWYGWCLAYAECAFGTPRLYATAHDAWLDTQFKHQDRNLPSGVWVLVWFDHSGDYGQGYKNYGHVALYKDGTIYSSPVSHKPYADVWTSIEQVEKKYSSTFIGWSEDISGVRVAINQGEIMDTNAGKEMYRSVFHREAESDGAAAQWNGQTATTALNDTRGSDEWKMIDAKVKNYDAIVAQLQQVQTALANEQAKPPVEVIKEVEKVVEKVVTQEVPVIQKVDTPLNWLRVIQFVQDQLNKIFKKG